MVLIRPLEPGEFDRVADLDVTETGATIYRQRGREIVSEPRPWQRPPWGPARLAKLAQTWADALAAGGTVLGAFDGDRLVGEAVLRPRLTGSMAQLQSLHVSAAYRRLGVARRLVHELMRLARQGGAVQLYVSATPSESAVGFYHSFGFAPTDQPHPELLALEPEDIQMIMDL